MRYKLSLKPVEDKDIPLLTKWLNQDYILKWYHDADDWLDEIKKRNKEFSWLNHFVVMQENTPIGFCQYYDCYDAREFDDWYEVAERGTMFSIDYLIGNTDYLHKGYGKEIVRILTETIKDKTTAKEIVVQPDKENEASNNVLIANGYVFDEQLDYYINLL